MAANLGEVFGRKVRIAKREGRFTLRLERRRAD
jgi:hypothetical protein